MGDDDKRMSADLQETDHRVGLVVVDDDSLTAWDLVYGHERDSMRSIRHIHVGDVVFVGVDPVGEGKLRDYFRHR